MQEHSIGQTISGFFRLRKGRASFRVLNKRITEGMKVDGIHVCQLIAAMIIASIGLNLDSTEAVIGAMLICPLMGSVIAIAYGVATMDLRLLKEAIIGLLIQIVVCLVTSTCYFVLSPISKATSELLTNSSATVWDALIALVGGFAGALGISRKQEPYTLLAGVAVATALMPPLCAVGFGLAIRDWGLAIAAMYELLVNVVFISFGAEIVFVILRVPLKSDLDGDGVVTAEEEEVAIRKSRRLRRWLVVCSLIFAIPCVSFSLSMVRKSVEENGTFFASKDTFDTALTTQELGIICPELRSYRIGVEETYDSKSKNINERVIATVETKADIGKQRQSQIEAIIRLNVNELDEVVFEVKSDDEESKGEPATNVSKESSSTQGQGSTQPANSAA